MAGRDPPRRRGGRLRLVAGLSVVLGAVAVLLTAGREPSDDEGSGRGRPPPAALAGDRGSPPSAEALKDGFEQTDASPRAIGMAMAIGVAVIALSIVGLFFMLSAFHGADRAVPPLTAQQRAPIPPPGPPLQASPQDDLASLLKRETGLLSTYQWLTPRHDAARIPIARAMALMVGLPLSAEPGKVRP